MDAREKNVLDLKSQKKDFVKRYGEDAEAVMYATATKRAKKQMREERNIKIKSMLRDYLFGGLDPEFQNMQQVAQVERDPIELDPPLSDLGLNSNT